MRQKKIFIIGIFAVLVFAVGCFILSYMLLKGSNKHRREEVLEEPTVDSALLLDDEFDKELYIISEYVSKMNTNTSIEYLYDNDTNIIVVNIYDIYENSPMSVYLAFSEDRSRIVLYEDHLKTLENSYVDVGTKPGDVLGREIADMVTQFRDAIE